MNKDTDRVLKLPCITQRTTEWHNIRKNLLTASDVPAAIGDSKYKSINALLKQKCGLSKEFKGNYVTEHGVIFERKAIELYEQQYDDKCYDTGLYIHPDHAWLGCSPDGITEKGYLVEVKCPVYREINDDIPVHYYGQIQTQLECLDVETCVFIQYHHKTEKLHVSFVPRDREWFSTNFPKMKEFWDNVIRTRKSIIDV